MLKNKKKRKPRSIVRGVGKMKFVRLGIPHFHWGDLYHLLLEISWLIFFGLISLVYFAINIIFAFAYLIEGDGIENAQAGSFGDAFFFSVQTMATIGYGAMYPRTPYTHFLVAIEVLIGLLAVAMATSLMFARFSRPTARVLFSRIAVICPYNGVPTLMFRVANQRRNWIVEAQIRLSILLPAEVTTEGHSIRRLSDLKLVRSENPFLALTWVVMHTIEPGSPLYGETADSLNSWNSQIVVTLTGLDETVSQTIHTRHTYEIDDLLWDVRFADILSITPDGDRYIDYSHFHDVVPLENNIV